MFLCFPNIPQNKLPDPWNDRIPRQFLVLGVTGKTLFFPNGPDLVYIIQIYLGVHFWGREQTDWRIRLGMFTSLMCHKNPRPNGHYNQKSNLFHTRSWRGPFSKRGQPMAN